MSTFSTEIRLENPRDAGNARHGLIKETEVRRLTVNALDISDEKAINRLLERVDTSLPEDLWQASYDILAKAEW
jgi:hypothetical protein